MWKTVYGSKFGLVGYKYGRELNLLQVIQRCSIFLREPLTFGIQ